MSHTHARAYGSLQHLRVRLARDAAAPPLPRIHVEGGRGAPRPERARQPAAALRRRRRRPGRLLAALVHAEHHVRRGELLRAPPLRPPELACPPALGAAAAEHATHLPGRCSGDAVDAVEMQWRWGRCAAHRHADQKQCHPHDQRQRRPSRERPHLVVGSGESSSLGRPEAGC